MGLVCCFGEIGKEGAFFVAAKAGNRRAVLGYKERPQKREGQIGHNNLLLHNLT